LSREAPAMTSFVQYWLIAAAALGLAVGVLSLVYRLLGSHLGTEGWLRETVIVVVTAAIQAGILVLVLGLHEEPSGHSFRGIRLLAFGASYLVYKISHLNEMTDLELSILTVTNFAAFFILWMLFFRQMVF
jgi:hypothetical protein